MAPAAFPLPFEQIRWQTRRFALSDFRFVTFRNGAVAGEIAIDDIASVGVESSPLERLTGFGTLVVRSLRADVRHVRLPHVARARRQALRLELYISEARGVPPADSVAALPLASIWSMPESLRFQATTFLAPVILLLAVVGVGIGLSGHNVPVTYPEDDAVRPGGARRPEAEIVAFMENVVMPWARDALGPVVGRDRVACQTCHGRDAEARGWAMPAVRALPEPAVRAMAEAAGSDAQVRNALHGYLAEGDNQAVAAYMRGVVTPGMASLLRRPAYDFAQTYEYNRSRAAFGCYHCHQVSN